MATDIMSSSSSAILTVSQASASPADSSTVFPNMTIWGPLPLDDRRPLQVNIIVCVGIAWLIALVFVALRFYTRGHMIHVLGPSDWFIIPSLLFAGGVTASAIEQTARGEGKHVWQLDPKQIVPMERAAWYGILFYGLSLNFTKVSILLLYLRIFTYNWARRAIQAVLAAVIILGIWMAVSVCTSCVPLEAFWNWQLFSTEHVYCHPPSTWWANSGLHIGTDILIVALPMPVLSRLNLPRRQKYVLVGVFALGLFVCLVSILRLVELVKIFTRPTMDPSYSGAFLTYWTVVEVNAAISCACIMTLKPFVTGYFPRLLTPASYLRRYTRYGSSSVEPRSSTAVSRWSRIRSPAGRRAQGGRLAMQDRRKASGGLAHPLFKPGAQHLEFDVIASDVEAQKPESLSASSHEQEQHPEARDVEVPPPAHLRLSIQVTRSVMITSESSAAAKVSTRRPGPL